MAKIAPLTTVEEKTKPSVPAADHPQKKQSGLTRLRHSFQSMMPQVLRDNSSKITQIGLLVFTSVMLGSVFRGRKISHDIYDAQIDLLKTEGKYQGVELQRKIDELVASKDKVIKKPGLHKWRMIYLPTAITSFAVGAFIKDKQTPEDVKRYDTMALPEYMGTRVMEAFDPRHHSRQTAGLIGATSGAFAIISALSQPGGKHVSEAVVGGTLISGFLASTFIKDPVKAKQVFSTCWWARLPVVISGTFESLKTNPAYKHPLADKLIQTPEFEKGLSEAYRNGVENKGFWRRMVHYGPEMFKGSKAAEAFAKSFTHRKLDYLRHDISYPIGQWGNMAFAAFGFLMAGSEEKKKAQAAGTSEQGMAKPPMGEEKELPIPAVAKQRADAAPAPTVSFAHPLARIAEQPMPAMTAAKT